MGRQQEIDRIKTVYKLRKEKIPSDRYSYFTPSHLYMVQSRERALLKALKSHGCSNIKDKRILDIGCGDGNALRNFVQYGASPGNCYGIDLLPERIKKCFHLSPNINFICGDASILPYEDNSFDFILQFTVFTSILDYHMKKNISKEMARVLKPDGIIVWYDYHVNNPKNLDVKGINKEEINNLFPGFNITLKHITLAPPLTRIIIPFSIILCQGLEQLKFLCTHYLGILKKIH